MINENEEKTHAKLSPSASKRWMTCPGSVRLIEALNIKDKPTKYAAEGTVAHKICELCLKENKSPEEYLNTTHESDGFKIKVTREMVDACSVYVDWVKDYLSEAELQVEVKCSLKSYGIPGLDGGTSDGIIIDRENKVLIVADFKYGSGVAVEADNNPQLMQYGLGAILRLAENEDEEFLDDWLVILAIIQPRAIHKKGPVRTWKVGPHSLIAWGESILVEAAKETLEPNAPLRPSDEACRFCPVNDCAARFKMVSEVAMFDFEEVSGSIIPSAETISIEQKIKIMDNIPMIRSFLLAIEASIRADIDSGSKDYEGKYKLVEANTQRKVIEEAYDEIASPLLEYLDHNDLYEKKPKGIGALEESLKEKFRKENVKGFTKKVKEILDKVTVKPKGEIVIAPESDSRPRISPSVVSDFNDLD